MTEINTPPQSPDKGAERQRVNRMFLNQYRGDAVVVPIGLGTTEIIRAYRKHFDGVSRSLFYIRYYSAALNNTNMEEEILNGVIGLLDQAAQAMENKNEMADNLLKEIGVNIKKGVNQTNMNAFVIDPLANRYLKLIAAADELARKYRALWMAMAIDDKQKTQAMNETANVLRQVHSKSTQISLGLRDRVSPKQSKVEDTGINNEAELAGNDEFQDYLDVEGENV